MSGETDTPGSTRFEKIILEKIHSEMRAFADTQELMRRDVSALKEAFAEWKGENKGKEKLDGRLEDRVATLEKFVDDLRMFKVKVAAYGILGGTVFGSIAAAVVNGIMKR